MDCWRLIMVTDEEILGDFAGADSNRKRQEAEGSTNSFHWAVLGLSE
jgi:hypothetical protein